MQEEIVENFYKAVNFLKVKLDQNIENFRKEYRTKYRQLYIKYEEERTLAENLNIGIFIDRDVTVRHFLDSEIFNGLKKLV